MVLASAMQMGINFGPLRAESGNDALAKWPDMIDDLRDRLRWDDRDYLAGDAFLDLDPAVADALTEQLRKAEDYFSAAPVEPTRAGVEEIRASRESTGASNTPSPPGLVRFSERRRHSCRSAPYCMVFALSSVKSR
jgi:hypothetical protein